MSFLMSTFKYVCAVFLRLNDLKQEDAAIVGWVMVMFDILFMLGSLVAFVLMVMLLRASANTLQENEASVTEEIDDGGSRSLVKVVPMQQQESEQQQQQEQRKLNLKKEIAALKWQKNIRQTLMKNKTKHVAKVSNHLNRVKSTRTKKVEEIERNHQNHRTMAIRNIKQQQVQRRSSLQLRVQARIEKNKTVEEKVVGGGGEIDVTNGKERIDMIRETAQ